MVQQNGVCHMKSIRDIEFEKQVKERKEELVEKYRAQNEEKVKTAASTRIQNAETLRSSDAAEEYHTTVQWRWKEERDEVEGTVRSSHVSNRLRSTPAPKPESDSELNDKQLVRTPSFRLNAGECQHNWILFSNVFLHHWRSETEFIDFTGRVQ